MRKRTIPSVIEILESFVAVDTRNPPGKELALARMTSELLSEHGVACEILDLGSERANLVARLEATEPQRAPLVLNGHMDTVPTSERWTTDPLTLVPKGDRLYGRGTADMKGALAAQLRTFMEFIDRRQELLQDIWLVWTAGEEVDCVGAKAISTILSREVFSGLVIGEPSENRVVIAQKGALWVRLFAQGHSAHGAYPERGANAIEACAQAAMDIKRSLSAISGHELLGSVTVNWANVSGGTRPNIVPQEAEALLDIRYPPPNTKETILDRLEAAIDAVNAAASIEYEVVNDRSPFETKQEDEFVQDAMDLTRQSEADGMRAYTDGSVFARHIHTPIIILGPGSMAQAHVDDEFISTVQLTESVKLYSELLRRKQA